MGSVVSLFVLPVGLLRWVWWRQNLYAEMIGFVVGFPLAYVAWFGLPQALHLQRFLGALPALKDRPYWQAFVVLFGIGLVVQVLVSLLTPPEPRDVLVRFYQRVRPPGFWGPIAVAAEPNLAARRDQASQHADEIRTGMYASAFAAALVMAMSALLVQRWLSGALLVMGAALLGGRVLVRAMRPAPANTGGSGGTPRES
jgi:hypothetical protein